MMELFVKYFEGAPKVPLGELLTLAEEVNTHGFDYPFFGVNKEKQFTPTIASTDGLNKKKYKIISKGQFVFSGMQTGRDGCIRFSLFEGDKPVLLSPAYNILQVKDENKVLPEYIHLYFLSSERDRLGAFYSDASVRANLELYRFFQMMIPLPPIEVQRQYVAAYKSLRHLAEQNEALAEPLQKACFSFLSNLKSRFEMKPLGDYIAESNDRNVDEHLTVLNVVGLSTAKGIIETKANMEGVSVKSYKVLKPGQIAYVPDTSRRGDKVSLGFNNTQTELLVSSISCVFETKDCEILDSTYLYLIFCRPEFDRLARYNSWGSARETFAFSDLMRVKIPVPPIEVQRSIVALYHCAEEARAIARGAREQLKKLAPAMVQRAANTPVEV